MNDYDPTDSDVVRALKVLVRAPTTRAWLEANDPKALAQAETALSEHASTHGWSAQ